LHFIDSTAALPQDEVDMYLAPADAAIGLLSGSPAERQGRAQPVSIPVIAFGPAALMRSCFVAGAADYLRDPWSPEELSLRALSVLQRTQRRFRFPWGSLVLDCTSLDTPSGMLCLTHHESRVLRALLLGRGAPVPRQAISYFLWGNPGPAGSRAIDAHVAALRRKISAVAPEAEKFIRAVRRQGYMIP
jgi:DNA-binding response OmpR family regulator